MWVKPFLAKGDYNEIEGNQVFAIQELNPLSNWVKTIHAITSTTKDPHFRIVCHKHVIATADSLSAIRINFIWLTDNLLSQLLSIDEQLDFVIAKVSSLVANTDTSVMLDDAFVQAFYSFSSLFKINEPLVNFYSCAYKNLSNQGWLYLSLSHICFHSFVFGVEIKLQLNIKDILVLSREKSKAGMVDDSIRIVDTANKEYVFSNLFHRDETFDLIEYMTNLAMRKLLKSTCTDPAPGLSYQLEAKKFLVETSTDKPIKSAKPLLEILDHQKRNHAVNITFNIPETEVLLNEISAICSISGTQSVFQGTSFLTSHFFCFISTVEIQCCMVIPLFTIKRVEKITNQNAISITLYHQLKIIVQFTSDKPSSDSFCMSLKDLLKKHLELMKRVKDFVSSCASEDILIDKPVLNGGLGIKFDFIEKHTQKDVQKIKYWINYMKDYGRNMTIVRLGTFIKLVRIGIPPTLRGEIWEVCCGSIYKRYLNPGHYQKLLDDNVGKTSLSTEEIEKDLNRSLPEYAGYQTEEGISTLRRVLYAFSFHDPEIGYCQAMNLVVSLFLIYLSEEQAFWILTVLCERLVNGYYSVNMVGAVVDNHVDRYMPSLSAHLKKHEIQLSVACLPWFLSLYINTLPLAFALRVVDCFFMEGPKVLFQIGLAILKTNGNEILKVKDDGELMNILKRYFAELGDISTNDPKSKQTRFNELMLMAYREFSSVTMEVVTELRKSHYLKVAHGLDVYAKRSLVRNLNIKTKLHKDEMFFICDKYFSVIYYNTGDEANRDLNPSQYKKLLCDITTWGDFNHDVQDQITRLGTEIPTKPIVGSFFLDLMFEMTDISKSGFVSFSNVIQTVDKIVSSDFATLVGIFFDLHDRGKLGSLNKEEMIQTSESLLFILRNEVNDSYLSSISGLISRAFQLKSTTEPWSISRNLFKELIEGDDFLKSYFTTGFKSSFVRADVETKQIIEPVKPVSTKDVMHAVENGVKWGVKWAEGINNSRNKTIVVDAAMGITTSVPSAGVDAELDVFEDSHEDMMNEVEELLKNAELLDTEGINLDSPLASPGIQSAPNAF